MAATLVAIDVLRRSCAGAWELARQEREVAVLEAGRLSAGVTAHTTAKLTALHTLVYDHLRRTRGPEGARLYGAIQSKGTLEDALRHGQRPTTELVDSYNIQCSGRTSRPTTRALTAFDSLTTSSTAGSNGS
ncbi:hypothetical protein [Streptomyces mirabilis]|uniref:hypothetical protein n=1 Tax=Streptomyces mirabilis TaxID=68239 RepID=UPI003F4B6B08